MDADAWAHRRAAAVLVDLGTLFGVNDPMSIWTGIATIPIFIWELSIGLYMTFKGFRPSAQLLAEPPRDPYPAVKAAAAGA